MTNVNPYSPPTAFDSQPASREMPSTRRLWIAYGIAPLVAPLVSAVTVFVVGMVYLANHPEDTGTPIGVIAFPVVLLVVGVPASYVVAGLIGMPIAFALRKRNSLNGYTVHGAALLWAALLGSGLAITGVFIAWLQFNALPNFIDFLGRALAMFLALAPFILLSATTFWLIGVRQPKLGPVSDGSCPD
jgi:hypothetical protein